MTVRLWTATLAEDDYTSTPGVAAFTTSVLPGFIVRRAQLVITNQANAGTAALYIAPTGLSSPLSDAIRAAGELLAPVAINVPGAASRPAYNAAVDLAGVITPDPGADASTVYLWWLAGGGDTNTGVSAQLWVEG